MIFHDVMTIIIDDVKYKGILYIHGWSVINVFPKVLSFI